jgi:hypothetical protein
MTLRTTHPLAISKTVLPGNFLAEKRPASIISLASLADPTRSHSIAW